MKLTLPETFPPQFQPEVEFIVVNASDNEDIVIS